ncbi:36985_t:CDS:2 [Gigaspora margarita]|uniref:36985_t:CDS:1 n=1 Tax=Gigaspora margarita TaxID=4874 RepID=A0ABN7UU93_GIGMA|nr:36985_t:CDS:2 [Gigaspora margarita]
MEKKRAKKRITKKVRTILEGYFLASEIESKIVPKISTIQN